uniref:sn-1-specific diacylglycerol lipase ABHD11 n=1 Tax=Junco hyemalis TaxID=40217 RepID=A0A8C5IDC8_JUNHY
GPGCARGGTGAAGAVPGRVLRGNPASRGVAATRDLVTPPSNHAPCSEVPHTGGERIWPRPRPRPPPLPALGPALAALSVPAGPAGQGPEGPWWQLRAQAGPSQSTGHSTVCTGLCRIPSAEGDSSPSLGSLLRAGHCPGHKLCLLGRGSAGLRPCPWLWCHCWAWSRARALLCPSLHTGTARPEGPSQLGLLSSLSSPSSLSLCWAQRCSRPSSSSQPELALLQELYVSLFLGAQGLTQHSKCASPGLGRGPSSLLPCTSGHAPFLSPCSAVPLTHVEVEGRRDRPPLVLLHGLFGSHSNFQTVAKTLARRGSGKVLTVDARNHGSSPHSPVMTYEAMSLDVQHLLSRLGITKCILVGHSMGGKTAMTLALQRPDLVERLISVDVGPGPTAPVSEFSAYISAMKEVKVPAGLSRSAARQLADDQLQPVVKLPQLRQFLLTNLVEVEGCYVWRVNLEAISRHLADLTNFPVFQKPYPGPALFLGGSDSPYISSRDYPEIERLFPKAEIQYIKGAGHIVHQDKFEEFITAVLNFLPQL